ncbi:MAG: hypothetical protein QM783_00770 [Phycisphaerales bacterium]
MRGEEPKPGEDRVGKDGEREGARAADAVAQAAEDRAARGPAEEERGLDPRRALGSERLQRCVGDRGIGCLDEFGDQLRGDGDIEVAVEPVEPPTERGGEQGAFLNWRKRC